MESARRVGDSAPEILKGRPGRATPASPRAAERGRCDQDGIRCSRLCKATRRPNRQTRYPRHRLRNRTGQPCGARCPWPNAGRIWITRRSRRCQPPRRGRSNSGPTRRPPRATRPGKGGPAAPRRCGRCLPRYCTRPRRRSPWSATRPKASPWWPRAFPGSRATTWCCRPTSSPPISIRG